MFHVKRGSIKKITYAWTRNFNKKSDFQTPGVIGWELHWQGKRQRLPTKRVLREILRKKGVRTLRNGNVIYVLRCKILLKTFSSFYLFALICLRGIPRLWWSKIKAMKINRAFTGFQLRYSMHLTFQSLSSNLMFISLKWNCLVLSFDVLANVFPKLQLINRVFILLCKFLFNNIKRLLTVLQLKANKINSQEWQTNDRKRGDVELLINFIIRSFSYRLLSAFEYFKYYSILSLCLL